MRMEISDIPNGADFFLWRLGLKNFLVFVEFKPRTKCMMEEFSYLSFARSKFDSKANAIRIHMLKKR